MALEDIGIASPCSADWNAMPGDDRVRTCGDCRKRVYNLAAMTRAEAEALIASRESLCVRLYRRRDGTIVTADCAPPLRRIRRKVAAGALAVLAGGCIDEAPEEENLDDDVTVLDDANELPADHPHFTFKMPLLGGIGSRSLDAQTDPSDAFDDLRLEGDSAAMGALASLSFEVVPDDRLIGSPGLGRPLPGGGDVGLSMGAVPAVEFTIPDITQPVESVAPDQPIESESTDE